jgi:hypothetical protein
MISATAALLRQKDEKESTDLGKWVMTHSPWFSQSGFVQIHISDARQRPLRGIDTHQRGIT